jgi:uncharacterized protein (DUF302 family)
MSNAENGLVTLRARGTVDEVVHRIETLLTAKGVKLFAVIDHSGEAEKAGLTMPPTKLLIFGNPKAGTPLMLASPGIAIDLPLKLLVAQTGSDETVISYNASDYLMRRHNLPAELLPNIAVIESIAAQVAP